MTGTHGKQRHLGNTLVRARADDIDEMKKFIARMDLNCRRQPHRLEQTFDIKDIVVRTAILLR